MLSNCFCLVMTAHRYGQEMLRLQAEHAALVEQQKLQVEVFAFAFGFVNVGMVKFFAASTAA